MVWMRATGPMVQLHVDHMDQEESRRILMYAQGIALGMAGGDAGQAAWQRLIDQVYPELATLEAPAEPFEPEDPNWVWSFNGRPTTLEGLKRQLGTWWGTGVQQEIEV